MIEYLTYSLYKRALGAAQEGDVDTLYNLRRFAEERGDYPESCVGLHDSIVSAVHALALGHSPEISLERITELNAAIPLYAQVSLIAIAAEEARRDITSYTLSALYEMLCKI